MGAGGGEWKEGWVWGGGGGGEWKEDSNVQFQSRHYGHGRHTVCIHFGWRANLVGVAYHPCCIYGGAGEQWVGVGLGRIGEHGLGGRVDGGGGGCIWKGWGSRSSWWKVGV